jgi:hypothetical protein
MKFMTSLSLMFVLVFGVVFSAQAEEKISGAFGIKLGQVFDPSGAIGKGSLTDGTPMYKFNPKKKFRSFATYYVLITPKTHKVYSIWGIGSMENEPSCKKEQALVMAILQKKYGKVEKDQLFSSLYDMKNIDQGNRYVLTKCSGFSDVSLDIRYKDKKLATLEENERILLESEKVDSSGL